MVLVSVLVLVLVLIWCWCWCWCGLDGNPRLIGMWSFTATCCFVPLFITWSLWMWSFTATRCFVPLFLTWSLLSPYWGHTHLHNGCSGASQSMGWYWCWTHYKSYKSNLHRHSSGVHGPGHTRQTCTVQITLSHCPDRTVIQVKPAQSRSHCRTVQVIYTSNLHSPDRTVALSS